MFLLILCSSDCRRTGLSSFTFHDVSINTIRKTKPAKKFHNFTFHDVSINTFFVSPYGIGQAIFTFHDVSINTTLKDIPSRILKALHSTMFLLIPVVYSSLQYRYNLTTFCQSCHFIIFILIFIFLDSSHF